MPLTEIRSSYLEVSDSLRALAAAAAQDMPGDALAHARRDLSQTAARVVGLREKLLIAPLRASPVAEHNACARRLVDQALQSRLRTIEFNARWTMDAIQADLPGYRALLREVVREIDARITEELATLHPMVLAAIEARAQA